MKMKLVVDLEKGDAVTKKEFHYGIDISVPVDTPIVAAKSGTIIRLGENKSFGKRIIIHNNDGTYSYYTHLNSFTVTKLGEKVAAGYLIAKSGNTGKSTGPHHIMKNDLNLILVLIKMMKKYVNIQKNDKNMH